MAMHDNSKDSNQQKKYLQTIGKFLTQARVQHFKHNSNKT